MLLQDKATDLVSFDVLQQLLENNIISISQFHITFDCPAMKQSVLDLMSQ